MFIFYPIGCGYMLVYCCSFVWLSATGSWWRSFISMLIEETGDVVCTLFRGSRHLRLNLIQILLYEPKWLT